MSSSPVIHIALPAMGEMDYLPRTLQCIAEQNIDHFHCWICVNQPESYHENPAKKSICDNNAATLEFLKNHSLKNLHIIDRSSPGKGWQESKLGVGMARKTIMDEIASFAREEDLIVSMDADTLFGKNYLHSVSETFQKYPDALALAIPYYHPMADDARLNRAMLRYEIYMRYYALNMRLTGSPFHFTPLGSAMACKIKAYRKIGGMTPKKSGEDFYFLQKMVKAGKLIMYNPEIVYPGNRLSDRVFFGTGPALIKGLSGQWHAYPLFQSRFFEEVRKTIDTFPKQFIHSVETPMDNFLSGQFRSDDIFQPLRKNHKNLHRFIKACHEKIDGLRILQYLKIRNAEEKSIDEHNLQSFLFKNFDCKNIEKELKLLNFDRSSIAAIDKIRNFLFENELSIRKDEAENDQQTV